MRLTERDIIERLQNGQELYAPLTINRFQQEYLLPDGNRADALIEFSVQEGPSFKALVEFAAVATPKNIRDKSRLLVSYLNVIKTLGIVPVVAAPYISDKQAKILADAGISWLDLSGNMSIRIPNKVYIERTGRKNRFPDTATIKKIFQGTSSLVSRALLLKPEGFKSQYELVDFINSRNANITAGTVSRVLKSLEEELLITKSKSLISVINTEKLLARLTQGYLYYSKRREKKLYRFSIKPFKGGSSRTNLRYFNYLVCGLYAAKIKSLVTVDEITILVKDVEQARNDFDFIEPDAEFGNLKFIETNDSWRWFNSTKFELNIESYIISTMLLADDIELYLEMMADTPRGPKIAEILKPRILKGEPR
jgi:hypothetical protein